MTQELYLGRTGRHSADPGTLGFHPSPGVTLAVL
jgi:hypothetical protein